MTVVNIAETRPSPGKPFTVAELDRMPDDGHRYELRDGQYGEAARFSGGEPFQAQRPFDVDVVPGQLVAGLQPPA